MYTQTGMLNQTKQKDITLKLYKCVFGLCGILLLLFVSSCVLRGKRLDLGTEWLLKA